MKISELSYRDYIAIDVVAHLAGTMTDKDAAWRAYGVADALLAAAGKRDEELKALEERAAKAERTLEILRPVWAQGFTSDSQAAQANGNALSELWAELGVQNQTDAMQALYDLQERAGD